MQLSDFRNEPFTDFSRPDNQQAFQQALQKVQKDVIGRTWPCWIGGEEVRGKQFFEGHDPGELTRMIGKHPKLGEADAKAAVEKAHAAFPEWSATDVQHRVDIFMRAAQRMRERKHEFSAMLVYEVGKSWAEADGDTAEAIDFLEYYAGLALEAAKPQLVTPVAGERNQMIYIPLGVGAIIPPWNFPFAIMAGMTCGSPGVRATRSCSSPPSQTPVIAARFVDLMHKCGAAEGSAASL